MPSVDAIYHCECRSIGMNTPIATIVAKMLHIIPASLGNIKVVWQCRSASDGKIDGKETQRKRDKGQVWKPKVNRSRLV